MPFDFNAAKARGNTFGIGVYIGNDVTMGSGNYIGHHCAIIGRARIGNGNIFSTGVGVGCPPRQRVQSEPGPWMSTDLVHEVKIGSNNFFEDYVTIQEPLLEETTIGDHVALGGHTRISHDCTVRDRVTVAAQCSLGGYVSLGVGVNLGMGVKIHPRTAIGAWAMLGLGCAVVNHILPGAVVCGVPAKYLKCNLLGLRRGGFSDLEILAISRYLISHETAELPIHFSKALFDFIGSAQRWGRERSWLPQKGTQYCSQKESWP